VKKDLNFDLNIMPILDILSVLITFLLLTAVWVDLSSVDMKQAVGDNSLSGATNPPSIWAEVSKDGNVRFSLRDIKEKMKLEYYRLEKRFEHHSDGESKTSRSQNRYYSP
jgi:biopolymer transport protein TolR